MIDKAGIMVLAVLGLCSAIVCLLTHAAIKQDPSKDHCLQTRRMFFAAAVLTGLGAVFMGGMVFYYYSN